jgi:hypothetical protein
LSLLDLDGTTTPYVIQSSIGISKAGIQTFNITVPDVQCKNCTFQWVWQSNEVNPYFGCADVAITQKDGGSAASTTSISSFCVAIVIALIAFVFHV